MSVTVSPGPSLSAPPGSCLIPLTRGYFAIIDAADYALVSARKWQVYFTSAGDPYARCGTYENGKCGTLYMSRLITGAERGVKVDHKSGDTLDNRRANLRPATHSQNMKNRRPQRRNPTGLRGVQLHQNGGYTARICADGRREYLGIFATAAEAASAYDARAAIIHGEFARLNSASRDPARSSSGASL